MMCEGLRAYMDPFCWTQRLLNFMGDVQGAKTLGALVSEANEQVGETLTKTARQVVDWITKNLVPFIIGILGIVFIFFIVSKVFG